MTSADRTELREAVELAKEAAHIEALVRKVGRGTATPIMVRQGLALLERSTEYAERIGDAAWAATARRLNAQFNHRLTEGLKREGGLKSLPLELELVEEPLAAALIRGRHDIKRQARVPGGRIDIYDETTGTIIECKARGDLWSLVAAVSQLRRYRPHFFDAKLAIAVPRVDDEARWFAEMLTGDERFIIFEIELGVGV